MPILNWTVLWGAIKPKWPLAESWRKKCHSLRHLHSPNRAHMLYFGAHKKKKKKKERNLLFSPFKSGKGPLSHEVGRNNSRKCFRDEIILATFMQIEDAGMKELCSSMREGRNSPTVQAGPLLSLHSMAGLCYLCRGQIKWTQWDRQWDNTLDTNRPSSEWHGTEEEKFY